MQLFLRIIILITLSLLGGLIFSFAVNLMVITGIVNVDNVRSGFGYEMTEKAVFVWIASVIIGIISIFMKSRWRCLLLLCPLFAPSVFAFLYAFSTS
jgi:hypothetical protein